MQFDVTEIRNILNHYLDHWPRYSSATSVCKLMHVE